MTDPHKRYLLRLSWPDSRLAPHAKGHWRPKAAATKAYRTEAAFAAKLHSVQSWPDARLEFSFAPPDLRRRDLHNMPSMMKAAIDGVADAMGVDDNNFKCTWPDEFSKPVKGGCVLIEVSRDTPTEGNDDD